MCTSARLSVSVWLWLFWFFTFLLVPLHLSPHFSGSFRPLAWLQSTRDSTNLPCPSSPNLVFRLVFFIVWAHAREWLWTTCGLSCLLPVSKSSFIVPHTYSHPYMSTMVIYGHPFHSSLRLTCFIHFDMFCYVLYSTLVCVLGVFAWVFWGVCPWYMS